MSQHPASELDAPAISERRLLLVLAAVQFVNVLDFVMVMRDRRGSSSCHSGERVTSIEARG